MKSIYQKLPGSLEFPGFKGRLLYMHKTPLNQIQLPEQFKDYQNTIEQMVQGIDTNVIGYITVDEKIVNHCTHRRAGMHVDFNWYEGITNHGEIGTGHIRNSGHGHQGGGNHRFSDEVFGGMLLASNYPGCRVYKGEFEGIIGEGGDCSEIKTDNLYSEVMKPHQRYFLNALAIHEPLIIEDTVERSLVRINFHPEYLFKMVG